MDTSDGFSSIEAPIFVIAKFPASPGGILYPDFSSYAWPESECPSEAPGSHVWSRAAAKIAKAPWLLSVFQASLQAVEWQNKTDELFWRGAATSTYRNGHLHAVDLHIFAPSYYLI